VIALGTGSSVLPLGMVPGGVSVRERLPTNVEAALRRVATLVARESSPADIFGAVTEEASRVLESEAVGLLRFEPGATATLVAQSDTPWDPPPLGTRFTLDGENVVTQVFRSGQAARVDDWTGSTGAVAAMATVLGVRSAVACPIVVEGRLWGTIIAATSQREPLPFGTESRVEQFTGLIATAIANADASGKLSRLAEEQAALRRVAVLVAQQPSPEEVFTAVTESVGHLLGADLAAMHSFRDGIATVIGGWSAAGPMLPVGLRLPLDGDSAVARIFRTSAAARFDGYADADGETAEVARGLRLRSTVGAPILVEGKLWGALMAATRGDEPLPDDAEARIAAFTELVATAVSNAQAHEDLQRLADEQAALRRVATLVARDAPPGEVFGAVTREVGTLLDADFSGMARFADDAVVPVATWAAAGEHPPVPERWPRQAGDPATEIAEARHAVRWDDWTGIAGPIAAFIRDELGLHSTVGTPIAVGGRLWGVLAVHSRKPLHATSESRMEQFSDLVATAILNAEARADLIASRARIVSAADEARRRIERDLHDGTQQRLIAVGLDLQQLRAAISQGQGDTESALVGIEADLESILVDLRELSHGLHPPLLARHGLGVSLQVLARRSQLPVRVEIDLTERPPPPVETAVYYVVSEALTNAIKHSHASEITVVVTGGGRLRASIADDGVGGADPSRGSGLTGLFDRVEALGGRFAFDSPSQGGTRILVELPLEH